MISLSLLIILTDPLYFSHTFNPFVMNLAMAALSIVALQLIRVQTELDQS
ncbi:hypothetical protein [Acinetobacter sp. ANC 4648]|nr:hypothetical protein [Acinetobacter sp. ANC 4648]